MDEVDLGYRFLQEYWGKGFATESAKASLELGFNTLDIKRVIAMVRPDNASSIHVLDKLQFKYEKEIIEDGDLAKLYSIEN